MRAPPLRTALSFIGLVVIAFATAATAQGPLETTGPYRVVMKQAASLPDHTVYRPADLSALKPGALPIVVFGNGACADAGNAFEHYLAEIASHGFLVIANGPIRDTPYGRPPPPGQPMPSFTPGGPMPDMGPPSSVKQLTDAIDWAQAQAVGPGPMHGLIDTSKIAVSGQSCGGIQALVAAADPRVTTAVIFNSGMLHGPPPDLGPNSPFKPGGLPMPKMAGTVADLKKLHAPMIYIIGGPKDIAYANANGDFADIQGVSIFQANTDTGHNGTLWEAHGGRFAEVASAWLLWRLKDDQAAGALFAGPDCGLCKSAVWTVRKKNLD